MEIISRVYKLHLHGAIAPKQMTLRDFLKSNPDVQWAYFPDRNQEIIIRFWNSDRTGRDQDLSALLNSELSFLALLDQP